MGIWLVLSGMLCLFIAHLVDKYSKKLIADASIFSGIFLIAISTLF